MHAPAICLLKSMTYTRCSQAIAGHCAGFLGPLPEWEREVSSTDRQVDLVQGGFDCVLRLGPIGDETLIARPVGKLRMVNAASPAYLARYGVPRSLEDLQRQEHRAIHFARTL